MLALTGCFTTICVTILVVCLNKGIADTASASGTSYLHLHYHTSFMLNCLIFVFFPFFPFFFWCELGSSISSGTRTSTKHICKGSCKCYTASDAFCGHDLYFFMHRQSTRHQQKQDSIFWRLPFTFSNFDLSLCCLRNRLLVLQTAILEVKLFWKYTWNFFPTRFLVKSNWNHTVNFKAMKLKLQFFDLMRAIKWLNFLKVQNGMIQEGWSVTNILHWCFSRNICTMQKPNL